MPCYDPPPPWEAQYRESAERAVRILCSKIADKARLGQALTREEIDWYIGHREIDLEIAQAIERGQWYTTKHERSGAIKADLAVLKALREVIRWN